MLDGPEAGDRIIRGGGLRVASYAVGVGVGLLSAPLLIRHLSIAEYGLYATASSIAFVIAGIVEGGLGGVVIREYSNAPAAVRDQLLRSLLGLRLVMTTIGVLIGVGAAHVAGYPDVLVGGVAILGVGLLIGSVQNTWAIVLNVDLRLGTLSAIDMARQVTTTVGLVALIALGASLGPLYLVAPAGLFVALVVTWRAAPQAPRLPQFDRRRWAAIIRQTGVFAVATALSVVYFQVAIISTSLLAGDEQAGIFASAFRVVEISNGIPWLLAQAAFPLLARAAHTDADRLRYALGRMFETLLIVGVLFGIIVALGAPFATSVLGGAKLDPAIPVLRTLAIGIPFTFLVAVWAFALLSLHQHRSLLTANGVAFLLAIGLSLILIPDHGARGAAWVTVTLEATLATGYAIALLRVRPDLRPPLGGVSKVLLALGCALAMGFVSPLAPALQTLVASAVFTLVIIGTRALPKEIELALRSRWSTFRADD